MLRDVFYFGEKPNVHPRERYAIDLADAKRQCTTEHFWVINDHCNYKDFDWDWDFDFLPDEDVWAEDHNNVWPSPYQKDSGTWLCSTNIDALTIYRGDVDPIPLKDEIVSNWKIIEYIEKDKFDFKWHPDPTDPPYIYVFGNEWYPATVMPTVEYHVPGATERKYTTDQIAQLLPMPMLFNIIHEPEHFDYSWRPDPTSPPYIYVFGNNQYPASVMPTVEFHVEGATERKYIENIVPKLAAKPDSFEFLEDIDPSSFDMSWVPDPTSPPYIYVWGNQWNKPEFKISVQHKVEGATEYKYMEPRVKRKSCMDNWDIPPNMFQNTFDFSWEPDLSKYDPPFIYQFGSQWQKTGGPRYVVPGATEIKYIDTLKANVVCTEFQNWQVPRNIDQTKFDFSWHPDSTEEPYIYQFPDQWTRTGGPRYVVPDATEIKYINVQIATAKQDKTHWTIPEGIDTTDFDFSWHPDIEHEPLIYQFGTQWQKTGGPKFYAVGCTESSDIKYVDVTKAKAIANMNNWVIPEDLDIDTFDFSWHPDSTEEPYIYQFADQWTRTGGPKYVVDSAIEIKYIDTVKGITKANKKHWTIPKGIDTTDFDFSWHPDIDHEPLIYQFGTQWQRTGGPTYNTLGTDENSDIAYVDIIKAKALPNTTNWQTLIPVTGFDYSWHPDSTEEPFIYVFGNQWNRGELEATLIYTVPGATQTKYINDIVRVAPYTSGWSTLVDIEDFDYSWRPDPTSPPYVYVFGNKQYSGVIMPTVKLTIPDATDNKYVDDVVATIAQKPALFTDTSLIKDFDYSWRPDPTSPPYIYQFGTQWAKTNGPKFVVEGAEETKFVSEPLATILPDMTHWEIPENADVTKFDFSWHPDMTSPPYIYQFGTLLDDKDGPRYITPGHNDVVVNLERKEIILEELVFPKYQLKTTLEDLIEEHTGEIFWALNPDLDYSDFDFMWVPDKQNVYHVNAFGSKDNINSQTYFVNGKMWQKGYRDINYVEDKIVEVRTKLDMFFIDKGNSESQDRFQELRLRFPNITKTRYLNSWVDTINRCITKSSTNLCWILNSELDYSEFEFDFYPSPWQMRMVHVFGTQWSHWGTTFMVNKNSFSEDTKYVKIIEHLSNLNFVKRNTAKATNCLYDIALIDHGNTEIENVSEIIKNKTGRNTTTVKYNRSYLQTFKTLLKDIQPKKEHYLWVCSSICDYEYFDFSYICDPYARDQLHVFPSDKQKFGDTFLIDVNKFKLLIDDMIMLEDYEKVNYNQHQRVKRLPAPTIITKEDTHVTNIHTDYNWPYATFITENDKDIQVTDVEPMSLWTPDSKNIIITSTGATRIIVPKEAKYYVEHELYDYPYISRSNKLVQSQPLDIVFLSNGETGADENYEHLLKVTKGLKNRVVRVDGVDGRVQAYHAAAEASNTPWMFTVFAKLRVNNKFDWSWQPDRLQIPKHYIFNATNPVNGLVYGHQAMIAYNKTITLANKGRGLDFTLDDEHEVVDMNSGVAMYNTDEWSTWRTAFREALKLRASDSQDSRDRLDNWLNVGEGAFANYSTDGANHAIEYYNEVNGDLDKLRLSYDWPWLKEYYKKKYK
jgi:hypothetical protein